MVNSDAIVWNEVDMIRAGGGRGAHHVIYLLRTCWIRLPLFLMRFSTRLASSPYIRVYSA